ncbi:hypothetical protein GLOIN_2v1682879 [Rhizophagus irregularis DAOM 181602=DAOM 197198]|nr:hypothetical protein GLOIN_2v1682879 [Rhizophagus irregularis DAOM 181602=DAOM 197198]
MLVFKIRKLYSKRVQTRPQVLPSFLICGQHKSSSMDAEKTVLNILTGRWIDPNRKLFQKLIREGYKYVDRLSDYLEDIGIIYE